MNNNIGPLGEPTGGKLDAAIDRAVRQMVALEPPPGLRHRVLARLKQRETPAWGFFPRFALAGAALAVVILAVTMIQPNAPVAVPQESAVVATASPAPEAAPSSVSQAPADAVAPSSGTAQPRREPLPAPPQMAEVFGTRDSRVAAASVVDVPLDDPSTPETEPGTTFRSPIAGLPPLRIEDLKVLPLQVTPLRINPLLAPR